MTAPTYAELLSRHIAESGLSYPAVAELAGGLDQAYVWRMARGERPAGSRNVVLCLAIALRLSVHETDELLAAAKWVPISDRRGNRVSVGAIQPHA